MFFYFGVRHPNHFALIALNLPGYKGGAFAPALDTMLEAPDYRAQGHRLLNHAADGVTTTCGAVLVSRLPSAIIGLSI